MARSQDYDNVIKTRNTDANDSQQASMDGLGGRRLRIKKREVKRVPLQMTKTTIDRIIYPVQTKRGLKFEKKKPAHESNNYVGFVPRDLIQDSQSLHRKSGKLLDGFLILYSCRVKLPHEAIKSKLDG